MESQKFLSLTSHLATFSGVTVKRLYLSLNFLLCWIFITCRPRHSTVLSATQSCHPPFPVWPCQVALCHSHRARPNLERLARSLSLSLSRTSCSTRCNLPCAWHIHKTHFMGKPLVNNGAPRRLVSCFTQMEFWCCTVLMDGRRSFTAPSWSLQGSGRL